jgi:excisionase family DNA binding protein
MLTEAMTQVERKTISIMKACETVGVSRRTIYNWLSSGKLEYVRTAGGSVRIFVDTLWRDPNHTNQPSLQMWPVEGRNQA